MSPSGPLQRLSARCSTVSVSLGSPDHASFRMSLLRAPTEIFFPLLVPLSPCPWDRLQITLTFSDEPPWAPTEICRLVPLSPCPFDRLRSRFHLSLRVLCHTGEFLQHILRARSVAWCFRFRMSLIGPQGLAASRSTVSVSLGPPQITIRNTPQKIRILLQHVSAPMPSGDREQWQQWRLCTLTPSRVRFTSSADSRLPFRMSLFGPPQRSSACFSFHCLSVSLGSPQITVSPLRPELGSGHRALGLCPVVSAVRGPEPQDSSLCPDIRDVQKRE
ncbi:Fibrous Sheath-Interacting Protein 2 [Manis pentadactyla]|nr:Fibrous Sheath-Interacting Protein 2 [Manis pentadactyla]